MNKNSKDIIKYLAKKTLNIFHYHKDSCKKDIFIFSSFRSGSTWLAELIKSQAGIKFPISPNKIEFLPNIDDYYKQIKKRPYYLNLSEKEKEIIKNYIINTSSGKLIYGRRYVDIFSRNHSFISERSIFRLLRSNYLINWFNSNFDIQSIYLFRHPIAASLSRKKIWEKSKNPDYWSSNSRYFLNSSFFSNNFLNSQEKAYLEKKLENAGILEDFIISWALENIAQIRKIQSNNLQKNTIFLSYEDLLINPLKVIDYLMNCLNLTNRKKLLKKLEVPSSTVNYSDHKTKDKFAVQEYDPEYLLTKWKNQITEEEEKEIFEILNRLGIEIYKFDEFMPISKFLI
ncbi:MAG: sulfotransferase domain-containing protein [Halanaerobium sp.]